MLTTLGLIVAVMSQHLLFHSTLAADLPPVTAQPYMSPEERELLEKHMVNGVNVLEYGSGGSTLFFTDPEKFNVKLWSCVDHNPLWAAAVLAEVRS